MTATNAYIEYKQYIDKCVSEMKACKDNQSREDLLRYINYMKRDIQTLYDIGDFNFDLSDESDEVFTDDQLKQLREDHNSDTPMF